MANGKTENGVTDEVVSLGHDSVELRGKPKPRGAVAPISDADSPARVFDMRGWVEYGNDGRFWKL